MTPEWKRVIEAARVAMREGAVAMKKLREENEALKAAREAREARLVYLELDRKRLLGIIDGNTEVMKDASNIIERLKAVRMAVKKEQT